MHFKKEHIIKLLDRISIFASENLNEIQKVVKDNTIELDSTYAGMVIRQYTIINDLKILFEKKTDGYLTSEFILFRCIIDDYIHLTYIVNQDDKEEAIINMNADAYNKNFHKLEELAKFNEEELEGKYPYYPTMELLESLQMQFKDDPKNDNKFTNKEAFKFKNFPPTSKLISKLGDACYSHSLRRAYYLWRSYSDLVHYSYFSYAHEVLIDPLTDDTYSEFAEIIYYSYMNILNSMQYFVGKYGLEMKDSNNLAEYYKEAGH